MQKIILSTGILLSLTVSLYSQTGPGGVGSSTDNVLWLKPDAGVKNAGGTDAVNGERVDTWEDQSGNGNDVTQGTDASRPTYVTGSLNGEPVLSFDGGDQLNNTTFTGMVNQSGGSVFSVLLANDNSINKVIFTTATATNGSFPRIQKYTTAGGHRWLGGGFSDSWVYSSSTTISTSNWYLYSQLYDGTEAVAANRINMWLDGSTQTVNTGGGSVQANTGTVTRCHVGNWRTGSHNFDGSIPELILYNTELNEAQRRIVENYLAAKYGLTISNDYFAYQASHKHEVAGIGRETATETHTDAMSDNILEVSTPSGLDANQEYLIFGHDDDDVTTSWSTTEAPNGGSDIQRLAREWRFSEINGDVGTVDFDIDISSFPALPVGFTSYGIMVDSDGDFSSGATVYEVGLVAGSIYDVAGINIADGDYVAICAIDPKISFSTDNSDDFEPNNAIVNIELNYIPRNDVTVDYTTADGSATAAQPDYTSATGVTATILAGNATGSLTITINDDAAVETDETFTITLSNPMAGVDLGAITVHTYTIHDDDNARKIYFELDTDSGVESASPVTVKVSMSSTSATDVTVDYSVSGGIAVEGIGNDFVLASGTVTIVGGSGLTSGSFTFTVNDDVIFESSETLIIELSAPTGCNLDLPAPSNAGTGFTEYTYTITDNDTPPEIQFTSTTGSGSEGTSPATIAVELSTSSPVDASATYAVADVTATGSGTDYTLASGTVTITASSTSVDLSALITDDSSEELSETFTITLSAPSNSTLGANTVHT